MTIRCNFIPGSVSRGCHVKIDGLGPSTISLNLERRNGSDSVQQEFVVAQGIGRHVELTVAVFDLESDGTIGNLSISPIIADTRGATTEGECMMCIADSDLIPFITYSSKG